MRNSLTTCKKAQRSIELKFAKAELDSLESIRNRAMQEQELNKLQQAAGITDPGLLQRLYSAGFTAENIHALHWLPIAMVAWANGDVAPAEVQAANFINLYAQSTSNSAGVRLFAHWLEVRPSAELWQLWREYAQLRAATRKPTDMRLTELLTLEIAKNVAKADGGFAGFGRVCAAERRLLQTISRTYRLA